MKFLWWPLAITMIVIGLITLPLPIPTGLPLLAMGSVIIIATNRKIARLIRNWRRTAPKLNKVFYWLEDNSPRLLARILKRTRPRSTQVQAANFNF